MGGMAAAFLVRWQNDQGDLLDHQLFIVHRTETGALELNNRLIEGLFNTPVLTIEPIVMNAETRKEMLDAARDRVEVEMMSSVSRFRHPNDLVLLAAVEAGIEPAIDQQNDAKAGPAGGSNAMLVLEGVINAPESKTSIGSS
jgi:hypothetical protein